MKNYKNLLKILLLILIFETNSIHIYKHVKKIDLNKWVNYYCITEIA